MRLLCCLRGGGRGAFRTYSSALLSDRLLNWTSAKVDGNSTARSFSRRPYWCRVCHRRRRMGCCNLLNDGLIWAKFGRSNGAPVRLPIDATVCKGWGSCALYRRRYGKAAIGVPRRAVIVRAPYTPLSRSVVIGRLTCSIISSAVLSFFARIFLFYVCLCSIIFVH